MERKSKKILLNITFFLCALSTVLLATSALWGMTSALFATSSKAGLLSLEIGTLSIIGIVLSILLARKLDKKIKELKWLDNLQP